jgi:uncharacterized hydrophobic protein (TIGR00271 family)
MTLKAASNLIQAQDRLLTLLGNSPQGRSQVIGGMLRRDPREATSYWLQLIVSIGIATLGLVVGSAAVVIGAMLVAPLMGPIVGLAMGLSAGSPFLVLRSAGRIGLSVSCAVGGAALITVLLPFHELNAEISARTSPTILDLITAAFCALAGVYAALRPGSDTATTAAGTSISISLVPPLCACGYGLGTTSWPVAGGAALLFLTNLVAIVAVGTVAFVAAGFNRSDVLALEREELEKDVTGAPIARALARRLSSLFESRWGPILRFSMPFILLAGVYVPLRRALDEVVWEVRVRAAVRASLAREPMRIVQSRVRVERHEADVLVVVLGSAAQAEQSRHRMDEEIRQASGAIPRLEIVAVADANAVAGLESTFLTRNSIWEDSARASAAVTTPTPGEQLDAARAVVRAAIIAVWPSRTAGTPLAINIDASDGGRLHLQVVHLGPAVAPDTLEVLRTTVGAALSRDIQLDDAAVPSATLTSEADESELAFVARVAGALKAAKLVPSLRICVVRPQAPERKRRTPAELNFERTLDSLTEDEPRVTTAPGEKWSFKFSLDPCDVASSTGRSDDNAESPEVGKAESRAQ